MPAFDPTDPAGPAFRDAVGARVGLFLDQIDEELAPVSPLMSELVGLARRFTAGGKRLRPAFCFWGHVAAGGAPADPTALLDATAGFELLHVAALVHDDLIDDSDTRRGMPAAHRQLEELHHRGGVGDPAAFGRAGAILLGDLLTAWSTQRFATAGLDPAAFARARWVLDAVRTDVNVGQFLDLAAEGGLAGGAGLATAEQVVEYKTARYTVIRPLQFGAALAGAPAQLLDGLAHVARQSAGPSSSATTCWGSSATRSSPASRPATTCARTSAPSWWSMRCTTNPDSPITWADPCPTRNWTRPGRCCGAAAP